MGREQVQCCGLCRSTFGPSTVESIEAKELAVTEVDRSALPMQATEEAEKTQVATLNH